ncbi:MAG: TonB-dependent receptor domain-containing protein [Parvularculaceae bacterium]
MTANSKRRPLRSASVGTLAAFLSAPAAFAQDGEEFDDVMVVTGSRIERAELTSPTPVITIGAEQISIDRSVTIEDVFQRLPQAGGGANATGAAVGDSLGSSTIDLRGLGQNRTLVLINGTRAVPFSFRNAVDTNSLPTGLIKRVDVLTGGAAAIYGADAVAGVVNFVLDDEFDGFQLTATGEVPSGGGESVNVDLIAGSEFGGGRGHVVGYVAYTERFELLAGERDFTSGTVTAIPSEGGNFTDVASGSFFAFDDDGNFSTTRQTTNVTPDRFLIQPLTRFHASVLAKYELFENVEAYGRAFFTDISVTGAGSTGQTPISVNEDVSISETNPFLPAEAAGLLTFVDGAATVNVERNLGLGLQRTETSRDTFQLVGGVRGAITDNISWDAYAQYGRAEENAIVFNNAIRNDASGASRFAAIADTVDIFGPDADLSDFSTDIVHSDRTRDQLVASFLVSGDTSDFFELPAGPIGFAGGYEYREETGRQTPGIALQDGLAFGLGGVSSIDAGFDTNEVFGEVLVPLLSGLPFIQQLNFEGAFRHFDFSTTGTGNADKFGGTWIVNDQLRFRGQRQTTVRSPNLGEFAGPEVQLSLSLFDPTSADFVPRLGGRFDGDPCLDGRGDAAQCAAFGAPPPGTPFDTSQAIYSFGGNPNIDTEKGETITVGAVITPAFYPGASLIVDYVNIEITDAVSQIQPIAALTDCYIDNPTLDNPLCGAVLRDPATGLISQALVNDFNLAALKQESFDVGLTLPLDVFGDIGAQFGLTYSATIVIDQSRQANATVPATECTGTFGGSCSGDFASFLQPDYKHRTNLDWANGPFSAQLAWRRIGGVVNASDPTDTISAEDYIDLTATYDVSQNVRVTAGIKNLFDNEPPVPNSGGNFFGTVSEYDPVGRAFGASVRARF